MAESLAPIDESVALPPAVRAAAERANAHYQAPATPQAPEQTPEPPAAQAVPAQTPEPPAPAPTPTPTPPANDVAQLQAELTKRERDYNALLGRNAQQREYIAMQQGQLASLSNPRSWATDTPQKSRPLITDEERKAYGDEALSVMERKAREAVQPAMEQLAEQQRRFREDLQRVKASDVYTSLDQQIPNWRDVNGAQEWKDWLTLPDIYSGQVRQQLLNQAFAAGDTGRILAFFRGFLAEYPEHMGQLAPTASAAPPASGQPVRKATLKLEDLAAPGRASPSPTSATSDAPTITNKDVSQFYRDITHGRYAGRDADKAAREAQIHAAVRDGRVQIVK